MIQTEEMGEILHELGAVASIVGGVGYGLKHSMIEIAVAALELDIAAARIKALMARIRGEVIDQDNIDAVIQIVKPEVGSGL